MLYYFYELFEINLFQYITVRAGFAFFIAFFLTMFLMPRFIRWAVAKKASQPISEFAPKNHQAKKNTPTMGGIVFLIASFIAIILSAQFNLYIFLALAVITLFGSLGIQDDLSKILQSKNAGMSSKTKFMLQLFFASLIAIVLLAFEFNTEFYIPFYKQPLFDMGIFALAFWVFIIVALSNAVNLTDGLDGLATVPSIFAFFSLGLFVYITGNAVLSSYLLMPKIIGVGEMMIVSSAFIGALIGFLWFNAHPAEVFMGDSGSLTLGAMIGYMAILGKAEILLVLIGFIFMIETLSVIIQIASYKTRGKKVFLMAPIHHHFELKEWAENKIIVRFWIIAFLTNLLALITIKFR